MPIILLNVNSFHNLLRLLKYMKSFYQALSHFTLKRWWLIIGTSFLLLITSLWISRGLQFKGDFIDLLPPDFQSVKDLNIITERAGGEGYFVIVLEGNLDKAKLFSEKLVSELQKFKEVNYIEYKFDKPFFENRNLLYIDIEDLKLLQTRLKEKIAYERNKRNPFYIDLLDEKNDFQINDIKEKYSTAEIKDYYITKNPERLVILVKPAFPASHLKLCKTLLSKTQNLIQGLNPERDLKVRYTGRYITRIEEVNFMFEDLKFTTIASLIGIFCLLLLYTRQLLSVVFIGVPLLTSLFYSVAVATLTIGYLNMVTSILMGILSGLGIDFGIHLYLRYLEERKRHQSLEQAIYTIHSSTGKPLFLAGLTTVAAFYSLLPMTFSGFSQFGFMVGTGILICLFNTIFLLPSLLIAKEKIFPLKHKTTLVPVPYDFLLSSKKYPKPFATVGVFAIVILVALWGSTHISFDYNFRKLSADGYGTLALQEEISDAFGVSLSPTVVYVPKLEDIPHVDQFVSQIKSERKNSTIKDTLSLFSYVPSQQKEKIPEIRKLGKIANNKILRFLEDEEAKQLEDLKRWTKVEPFTLNDLPSHLFKQFNAVGDDPGSFLFIFPAIDLWQGKEVIRYAEETRKLSTLAEKQKIHVASESIIFADIFSLVRKELPWVILFSALTVFFFLWIEMGKLRSVFIVLAPLTMGIIALIAIMYVFNIRLNFMNSIIFTLLLGMGEDNGMYIYHRYKEMGPGSLRFVIKKTGSAIFLSSSTTMIGFGSLLFANHKGLQTIGLLGVLGIGCCLISSLTFLPALLQIFEDRALKNRQKTKIFSESEELLKKVS